MRRRQSGFSMVELMVGVVIALIVVAIIMQTLAFYEAQKRETRGGSDSVINGALALFQVERDARMGGYGLMTPTGPACAGGMNIYYNGSTYSNGAVLAPISIVDGASGAPDQISIMRSQSSYGIAPATLTSSMADLTAVVEANSSLGIAPGDLFMVSSPGGSKVCTLMQADLAPTANGSGFNLTHASTSLYNPAAPAAAFATGTGANYYGPLGAPDIVTALGAFTISTYQLQCNDNGLPSNANSCDLVEYDAISAGSPVNWANANLNHIASQIVDFQAQYGIAAAGDTSGTVTSWVDATGATWAAPSATNMVRIKAIRVALVARSSTYDKNVVSPSTLVLWPATASPAGAQKTTTLSAAQQHYRYKVFYQVIPLINMIWANV